MAETIFESILPSGHGIRFAVADTKLTLDITERAAGFLPRGETPDPIKLQIEVSKETIATCVRGISYRPLEIKMKPADPSAPVVNGIAMPPTPDLEATLLEYRDPAKKAWKELSYLTLTADGPNHMLEVFNDPRDWRAALDRINSASRRGALLDDPFRGLTSIRTG